MLSRPLPPDARFVAGYLDPGLQTDSRTVILVMLVAPRGLVSAHLVCIAQNHAKRIVQYGHKRARLGNLIVRSMSDEGKAAQKSVESGCVHSLHACFGGSECDGVHLSVSIWIAPQGPSKSRTRRTYFV